MNKLVAVITLMQGGGIGDVVNNVVQQGALSTIQEEQVEGQREFTDGLNFFISAVIAFIGPMYTFFIIIAVSVCISRANSSEPIKRYTRK